MFPFYMFSGRELAPKEDQSVIFGIIQASANSTLDQTKLYTKQVFDVYRSFPEYQAVFQITFPTGGFGGQGFTQGPLGGRLIAELITTGGPSIDLTPYRPDRAARLARAR